MLRLAFLLAFLAATSVYGQGQVRAVAGGTALAPSLRSLAERVADPDSARRLLVRWYSDRGYLSAAVTTRSDTAPGMTGGTIEIREGERALLVEVVLAVPDSVRQLLDTSSAGSLQGMPFDADSIDRVSRVLVAGLADRGFAFVRVVPDVALRSATAVSLTLHVDPGERVRVDDVLPLDAPWADRDLVRRAAAVEPGTIYSDELVEAVRARLSRLAAIRAVGAPQLVRSGPGHYLLQVPMEEGTPNVIDGVVGYQPSNDSAGGSLFGMIRLSLADVFGGGRTVDLNWRGAPAGSQLLFRYAEPYLFDLPLELVLQYDQDEQRSVDQSLFIQRTLGASFSFTVNDRLKVLGGGSLVWTTAPLDTLAPCEGQIRSSRLLESKAAATFDTRNDALNPRSGLRLALTAALGSREFSRSLLCDTLAGSLGRQRGELDIEGYLPLASFLVAAGAAHYGEVLGEALDISDLFRFGGLGTVRGLRENELRVRRRVWGTLELRVPLDRFSYAGLFVDAGSVWVGESRENQGQTVYGYGVAGQIETPVGIAQLAFALGRGDTFDRGKVTVGLVNRF